MWEMSASSRNQGPHRQGGSLWAPLTLFSHGSSPPLLLLSDLCSFEDQPKPLVRRSPRVSWPLDSGSCQLQGGDRVLPEGLQDACHCRSLPFQEPVLISSDASGRGLDSEWTGERSLSSAGLRSRPQGSGWPCWAPQSVWGATSWRGEVSLSAGTDSRGSATVSLRTEGV